MARETMFLWRTGMRGGERKRVLKTDKGFMYNVLETGLDSGLVEKRNGNGI